MSSKILVGGREVLTSGSVLSYNSDYVQFNLEYGGEIIILRIKFVDELPIDSKGDTLHIVPISGQEAEIHLHGWNSVTGVILKDPLPLGTIGGRPLSLGLRVSGHTTSKNQRGIITNRLVSYTWLMDEQTVTEGQE